MMYTCMSLGIFRHMWFIHIYIYICVYIYIFYFPEYVAYWICDFQNFRTKISSGNALKIPCLSSPGWLYTYIYGNPIAQVQLIKLGFRNSTLFRNYNWRSDSETAGYSVVFKTYSSYSETTLSYFVVFRNCSVVFRNYWLVQGFFSIHLWLV